MKRKRISLEFFIEHHQTKRPINWCDSFKNSNPLDVEIGFGRGDFITSLAKENPSRNFLGIEQHWDSVYKTLRRLTQEDIKNIRVMLVDARLAFERFLEQRSIANVYCLFPCPWPKKQHIKHRLFSRDFMQLVNSRLVNGGKLRIVTDHLPFVEWILEEIQETGFKITKKNIKPTYNTKYERKWVDEGKKDFFEIEMTKTQHIDVEVKGDVKVKSYFIDSFNPAKFSFQDQKGETSVIFKELIYDEKKKKGLVHLIVAEKNLTQHFFGEIAKQSKKWKISPTEGNRFLPTFGIAQAIKLIKEACHK